MSNKPIWTLKEEKKWNEKCLRKNKSKKKVNLKKNVKSA